MNYSKVALYVMLMIVSGVLFEMVSSFFGPDIWGTFFGHLWPLYVLAYGLLPQVKRVFGEENSKEECHD